MTRFLRWLALLLVLALLVLGGVALALRHWVGSDDFRARVQREAGDALGVPLSIAAVTVDVWPLPAVALDGVGVHTKPPLTLARVEARPVWQALLHGRLEVATLFVRGAVLPQEAVAALAATLRQRKPATPPAAPAGSAPKPRGAIDWLPRHTVLDGVTWIDAQGHATTVDAKASLGDDGLPDSIDARIAKGRLEGTQAALRRTGKAWDVDVQLGGGRVRGTVTLDIAPTGAIALAGQLKTTGVEVASLIAPASGAQAPLSGKLEAASTLDAHAANAGALVEALRTQTRFTVHGAVVHGIDLARAVKTVGLSRGGQTALDTLAGQVATQGRAIQVDNLAATSGALSASGNVTVSPDRRLGGRVTVNLLAGAVGGALGVPLSVGGTVEAPEVTLSRAALLGAVIGTAVMPGVGTEAGARLGGKLGDGLKHLFGR